MPETYTKSERVVVKNWFYNQTYINFGWTTAVSDGVSLGTAFSNSLSGYKNPAHRAQIRALTSATTPLTGTFTKLEYDNPGRAFYRLVASDGRVAGWTVLGSTQGKGSNFLNNSLSLPNAAVITSCHNQAVSKLYGQLNSFVSSAKTGEDWGEWKSTMKTLRSPLKPLRDLVTSSHYRSLRDLERWRDPVKLAGALADTHLEFAFGIAPLESSIAKGIVGLQNREVMGNYQPFYAKAEVSYDPSTTNSILQGDPFNYVQILYGEKVVWTLQEVYSGIWGEECLLPERPISDVLGLKFRDIVPTIWNLIPYSFLIDYFVNIGQIASALAVPWNGIKWCNKTSRIQGILDVTYSYRMRPGATSNMSVNFSSEPGNFKVLRRNFNRSSQADLPVPYLEFTKPWQLTGRQWANLAALGVSQSTKYLLALKKVVKKNPELPTVFLRELGQRASMSKVPYPFHRP